MRFDVFQHSLKGFSILKVLAGCDALILIKINEL